MSEKKLVDQIINYDSATISGFFKAIVRLKITTLIGLITIIFSFISAVFMLGRYSNEKEIAIELKKPFDMKIVNGPEFKDLVLVQNNNLIEQDGFSVYTLKKIKDEFEDIPIGQVVIKKDADDAYNGPFSWIFKK